MDDFKPDDFAADDFQADDFAPDTSPAAPTTPPSSESMVNRAWEALKIPEQKSREGLTMIASAIPKNIGSPTGEPTGNMFRDIAAGTPRILADTLAEVAPSFVSRAAITTAGAGAAAKGLASAPLFQKGAAALGKAGAGAIEKTTGIGADKVANLFKKPLELFAAPSSGEVRAAYAKSELPAVEQTLDDIVTQGTSGYAATVKRAGKAILTGEQNPKTILDGRKALDKQLALLNNQIDAAKSGARSALIEARNAKLALRAEFNKALDILAPKLRAADRIASRQMAVAPFRELTLPGKINFFSPEGMLRAVPGLPTATGLGISAAGGAAKLLGKAIGVGSKVAGTAGTVADNIIENPSLFRRNTPKPLFRKAS